MVSSERMNGGSVVGGASRAAARAIRAKPWTA
jgi:hypothetical protein